MLVAEYLIYIPIFVFFVLFWFVGIKIFKSVEKSSDYNETKKPIDKLESIPLNTRLDDQNVDRELNKLRGKKIEKVFYININYPLYEYEKCDSIDFGIILQIEGGRYLNWIFKQGSYDWRGGANINMGYYIDFSNIIQNLRVGKTIFEVSEDEKWKKFIHSAITNLELKRVDLEGSKVCESLIIETESKAKVGIFSTNEPEILDNNSIQVNLEFEVIWISVVFDKELLKN